MTISRRSLLAGMTGLAGAIAHGASKGPRPGCQANAWNLDPARFDLLLTAVREIKQLGFEGYETNLRFLHPQLGRVREARAELEGIGVEFVGAHTNVPNYESSGLERAADEVSRLSGEARQFGAHALVVSHHGLSPNGTFPEAALDQKAKMLDLAGRRCADAGLVLAYHNHQPEFKNGAAEELALITRTDPKVVFLLLDIGHAWLADADAIAVFEQHHARAYGLHVRDFHNRAPVPLGQGEFPLRKLAEAIRQTGWSGWLINEDERPDQVDKPGMKAAGPSRKTMREIFGV